MFRVSHDSSLDETFYFLSIRIPRCAGLRELKNDAVLLSLIRSEPDDTKASRPTFPAMRALSSRGERTSVRHRNEKKGRLVNAPPDQGQPRASIPLPIHRRATRWSFDPHFKRFLRDVFCSVVYSPPSASFFAHLPPTFPGCLTWSVASSCTRATRTFSERRPTI